MTAIIRWSRRAALRLEEAARYFETARQGAGELFVDEVAAALDQAATYPMANPHVPGEPTTTRKAVLPRFSFWIIYEVGDNQIVVLTLWSPSRKPGSWHDDAQR